MFCLPKILFFPAFCPFNTQTHTPSYTGRPGQYQTPPQPTVSQDGVYCMKDANGVYRQWVDDPFGGLQLIEGSACRPSKVTSF